MRHPDSTLPPCDLADRPQGTNSTSCPTCRGDLDLCPWWKASLEDAEKRKNDEEDG